jgi:hypothetical protein
VSIGERQWVPAPGGITVNRDPMRPAQTWEAIAAELCEAVRGRSAEPFGVRAVQSDAAGSATGRRRGMIG